MVCFTLLYGCRVLVDIVYLAICYTNQVELQESAFIMVFSMALAGIRPFTVFLFPCYDEAFFQTFGYCPDRFVLQGEPVDVLSLYTVMVPIHLFVCCVLGLAALRTRNFNHLSPC